MVFTIINSNIALISHFLINVNQLADTNFIISYFLEYYNKTLFDILNDETTWEDQMLQALQKTVLSSDHNPMCVNKLKKTVPGVSVLSVILVRLRKML